MGTFLCEKKHLMDQVGGEVCVCGGGGGEGGPKACPPSPSPCAVPEIRVKIAKDLAPSNATSLQLTATLYQPYSFLQQQRHSSQAPRQNQMSPQGERFAGHGRTPSRQLADSSAQNIRSVRRLEQVLVPFRPQLPWASESAACDLMGSKTKRVQDPDQNKTYREAARGKNTIEEYHGNN